MDSSVVVAIIGSILGSSLLTTLLNIHFTRKDKKSVEEREAKFDTLKYINMLGEYALECKKKIFANYVAEMDGGISLYAYRNNLHIEPPAAAESLLPLVNEKTPQHIIKFIYDLDLMIKNVCVGNQDIDHPDLTRFQSVGEAVASFNSMLGFFGYTAWQEAKRLKKELDYPEGTNIVFQDLEDILKGQHEIYSKELKKTDMP